MKTEEKVCKECDRGGRCGHWLLQCSAGYEFRKPLLAQMDTVKEDFSGQNDKDKAVLILFIRFISIYCETYLANY